MTDPDSRPLDDEPTGYTDGEQKDGGQKDVAIASQERASETSRPTDGTKQKRAAAVPPPKRVVDIQRRDHGPTSPLPVAVPEHSAAPSEITRDLDPVRGEEAEVSGTDVALNGGAALDTATADAAATDETAATTDDPSVVGGLREDAVVPDAEDAVLPDAEDAVLPEAQDAVVPDAERSAPRSAVAHVAVVEQHLQEVPQTGRRARTLVPQLFAATVIGFIAVAGVAGVLLPREQAGAPMLRTETVPDAPSDSGPTITPAPTQTPDLVIPSVPMDSDQGSGDPVTSESTDQSAAAPSGTPGSRGSGSASGSNRDAATARTPVSPTEGIPTDDTVPGTGTTDEADAGTDAGSATGTVPNEVTAPPPGSVEPAEEGGDGETVPVLGAVIDVVEEILR